MQATVETVIKVSGNRKQDPEPEAVPEETPAPSAAKPSESEQGSLNSIIHHSWGHHTDRKAVPEVGAQLALYNLNLSKAFCKSGACKDAPMSRLQLCYAHGGCVYTTNC